MNIEEQILEQLRGEADYDTLNLLRQAYAEIVELREQIMNLRDANSSLQWSVDYHRERAQIAEERVNESW